jgi:membrane protein DedA with SNARE-associated domain
MEKTLSELILESLNISIYLVFAISFFASMLKYVVPPLPGDLTMLLLSFYTAFKGKSLFPVGLGIAIGGIVGSFLAYRVCSNEKFISFFGKRVQKAVLKLKKGFLKFSFFIMVFNRFLPGVKPTIFPIAGIYKIDLFSVISASIIGTTLYSLFICSVGYFAKTHIVEVNGLYHILAVWIEFIVLTILFFLILFAFRKKIRSFFRG